MHVNMEILALHHTLCASCSYAMFQVVVVVANRLLYWDLLVMLDQLNIPHDHLDAEERIESTRTAGRFVNRARVVGRGLERFKRGESLVMVLEVLVSCKHSLLQMAIFSSAMANKQVLVV